jgi:hypothetical protein
VGRRFAKLEQPKPVAVAQRNVDSYTHGNAYAHCSTYTYAHGHLDPYSDGNAHAHSYPDTRSSDDHDVITTGRQSRGLVFRSNAGERWNFALYFLCYHR